MKKATFIITETEAKILLNLLDISLKAAGLKAGDALYFAQKIKELKFEEENKL